MWRVQTDEPCGGVISGWDGRTLRRVSGRTRDGWRGGKAGEWGIGSVIRCSTVRAVRARVREKRRDKGRWVQVRTGGGARRGVGAPSPAYKPPHGRGRGAESGAPRENPRRGFHISVDLEAKNGYNKQ